MVKYSTVRMSLRYTEDREYERILARSQEYRVARKGLGPYVGFGLSDLNGTLTMAIGKIVLKILNFKQSYLSYLKGNKINECVKRCKTID